MRIHLFPLFFLLLLNCALTNPQNKVEIASQSEMLYVGIETPFSITINGRELRADEYSVQDDPQWPGRISWRKTDSCLWIKVLRSAGKRKFTITNKNGEIIGWKEYFAIPIPNPEISLDGMKGGPIQPSLLRSSLGLLADYNNSVIEFARYQITSYTVIITNGTETCTFTCKGPLISDTVRYYFQHLKFPYRVEFRDICDSGSSLGFFLRPLVFESGSDGNFGMGYWTEVGKYEDSLSIALNLLPLDSTLYRQDYPTIIETNCNSSNDTCTTYLYYIINGHKELALIYQFQPDQSERYKQFYKGHELSDITFWKESNAVNERLVSVIINYSNGQLMKEGSYYMGPHTDSSWCYRRDPVVYGKVDTLISVFRQARKYGPWKYYADGKLIKTQTYRNDTLIDER